MIGPSTWIDLLLLVIIFFYVVEGFGKGFFTLLIELAGYIISLFAAFRFYAPIATFLSMFIGIPGSMAGAIAFLFVGVFVQSLYSTFLFGFLLQSFHFPSLIAFPNKILGAFLGFVKAFLILLFVLMILVSMPLSSSLKRDIFASKVGGSILSTGSSISQRLGNIFGQSVYNTFSFFTI